jgi:hypothetical protein
VLFIVGGAAVATGVTLIALPTSAPSAPEVSLALGPRGLDLRGTW